MASAFIFFISPSTGYAQEDTAPPTPTQIQAINIDTTDTTKDEKEPECAYKKHWKEMKSDWTKGKKSWHKKSLGLIVLHKIAFTAFALLFIFLAAIVARKGWERGGKK